MPDYDYDWDLLLAELSEKNIITDYLVGEEADQDIIKFDWKALEEYDEALYNIFWEAHMGEVQETLVGMVEDGLIEERIDENGEVVYFVPDDVRDALQEGLL